MQEHPLQQFSNVLEMLPTAPDEPANTCTILEQFGFPTLRRLRRHLRECNAALAAERWSFADAVNERGTGAKRRWEPTRQLPAVTAACRRIVLAEEARLPGWKRMPVQPGGEPFLIEVRTLRLHTEELRCEGGLYELYERIDRIPYRAPSCGTAVRRGEVHMHEIRRGTLHTESASGYPVVPDAYAYNGLCTRGRGNPPLLPGAVNAGQGHISYDEPIVAEIAIGTWMDRLVPCHDPVAALERVAAEPVDWSEWQTVRTLPLHRHVETIRVLQDGKWLLPPAELRYRRELTIFLLEEAYTAERLTVTRQNTRMALEDARWRWQEKYRCPLSVHAMRFTYSDGKPVRLDTLDPPLTPAPGVPVRAHRDVTDSEWILPGFPTSPRTEIAESYRGRGDPDSAIALLRQVTQATPYDLSALEDLAWAHDDRGNHDEYRGLIRELVARGRAMLPKDFAWRRGQLPWHDIENRPFLRACRTTAIWAEEDGDYDAALLMYRRLLRVSPDDNLGIWYRVLRLAMLRNDWKALKTALRRVSDETGPEAGFARACLLLHTTPDGDAAQAAVQEAVDHNPLVASRIVQGDRPPMATEGFSEVGSFGDAERYWRDYGAAWLGTDKKPLMVAIRKARQRSPRMRKAQASLSVLHDSGAIAANFERYRRALMGLADVDPRHRDEFWDLAYLLEKGGQPAELASDDGRLEIRWHGFRIALTEPWQATLEPVATAPTPTPAIHFDAIVERLRKTTN